MTPEGAENLQAFFVSGNFNLDVTEPAPGSDEPYVELVLGDQMAPNRVLNHLADVNNHVGEPRSTESGASHSGSVTLRFMQVYNIEDGEVAMLFQDLDAGHRTGRVSVD